MIEKHFLTIYITFIIASAAGVVVGIGELNRLEHFLCGCVGFGLCLFLWWQEGKRDDH